MTEMNFLPQPNGDGLVKIRGHIAGYHCRRDTASFVFTESDQTKMGVIAIGAAMVGLGGQAISAAANATSMEEEADYLQFTLNGLPMKGWVWRSPFKVGDEVEVAAEWQGDHFEVFGIFRERDRTIALYPHCSRGIKSHISNAVKWWGIGTVIVAMIVYVMMIAAFPMKHWADVLINIAPWVVLSMSGFFGLMTYSLTRRWLSFVRLSEKVFRALGWPNPSGIDLVKSSNRQRTEKDPGEFGTFYFRR